MLDLKGIMKSIEKLEDQKEPGKIEIEEGRKHTRYTYILEGTVAFSFGLTRSSKAKSKTFYYVPQDMGLTMPEYRKLHDCPWTKKNLNEKLIQSGMVKTDLA